MASLASVARYARVALRSRTGLLIALRQACVACAALRVAGIRGTRTALRVAGIGGTRAALRIAGLARACAALRVAGLASSRTGILASSRAGMLTTTRIAGLAGSTVSDGTRIALRPGTRIVTREPKVCAGNGDRPRGSPQLYVEVKFIRSCSCIMLPRHALCSRYWSILLHEYPGTA